MRRVYLDNNATTALLPEVLDAMLPFLTRQFGNASSVHREGRIARRAVESSRESIATLLGADPDQVIFTSGGTESNNLAVFGLAGARPTPVIASAIEHPSVRECFEALRRRGFNVAPLPVSSCGVVSADAFAQLARPGTRMASVMYVNNETGAIQPIAELAAIARQAGMALHSDAVQAVGRIPVSFRALGVDALSCSAHKFHGPLGVGALLLRDKSLFETPRSGGHQEHGLRPGTEPVALIVGMAKALEIACRGMNRATVQLEQLHAYLDRAIRDRFPAAVINGPADAHARVPHTLNVQFTGIDAQATVMALDLLGVACSTGSACASGAATPSETLRAMGLSETAARSSIRFSMSRLTTHEELDQAVEAIAQVTRPVSR